MRTKTLVTFIAALFILYQLRGCKKIEYSSASSIFSFTLNGHTYSGKDSVYYQLQGGSYYFEVVGGSNDMMSNFMMKDLSLASIPYGASSSTELFVCFLNLNTDSIKVYSNDLTFQFTTSTSNELVGNFSGTVQTYINSAWDSTGLTDGHFSVNIGN